MIQNQERQDAQLSGIAATGFFPPKQHGSSNAAFGVTNCGGSNKPWSDKNQLIREAWWEGQSRRSAICCCCRHAVVLLLLSSLVLFCRMMYTDAVVPLQLNFCCFVSAAPVASPVALAAASVTASAVSGCCCCFAPPLLRVALLLFLSFLQFLAAFFFPLPAGVAISRVCHSNCFDLFPHLPSHQGSPFSMLGAAKLYLVSAKKARLDVKRTKELGCQVYTS